MRPFCRGMMCAVVLAGCGLIAGGEAAQGQAQTAPPARTATEVGVRSFVLNVAEGISQDGPTAWRRYFADTPEFFMALNGHLEFSDSASATKGIEEVAKMFPHITLHWGDDLRVDVISPGFAMIGTSYHEDLTDSNGNVVKGDGYFTGLAEYRGGRWQFRNAHWSAPVQGGKAQ